jgi:hypothetical protein
MPASADWVWDGALRRPSRLPLPAQTGRAEVRGFDLKIFCLLTPTLSSRGGGEGEEGAMSKYVRYTCSFFVEARFTIH